MESTHNHTEVLRGSSQHTLLHEGCHRQARLLRQRQWSTNIGEQRLQRGLAKNQRANLVAKNLNCSSVHAAEWMSFELRVMFMTRIEHMNVIIITRIQLTETESCCPELVQRGGGWSGVVGEVCELLLRFQLSVSNRESDTGPNWRRLWIFISANIQQQQYEALTLSHLLHYPWTLFLPICSSLLHTEPPKQSHVEQQVGEKSQR